MSLARKPFFELPFPTPPTAWTDLTQSQRDAWVDYARSVKIGWLDYQTIIRQSDDAYYFAVLAEMMSNGGTSTMLYPPGLSEPPGRAAAMRESIASTSDEISIPPSTLVAEETTFVVWGTAPAATAGAINPKTNKYIGSYVVPAGTDRLKFVGNLGAGYVTAFGTLAANLGDWVLLFVFCYNAGKLTYNGGYQTQVRILTAYRCDYYWPLNELSGIRRSIASPYDLLPVGAPLQVAGPIDNATRIRVAGPASLQSDTTYSGSGESGELTVATWFQVTNLLLPQIIISKSNANTLAGLSWLLQYVGPQAYCDFTSSDGTNIQATGSPIGSITAPNTWFHVVARFSKIHNRCSVVVNAAAPITAFANYQPQRLLAKLRVGTIDGATYALNGAVADACFWNRELRDTEVTALYNAGAGRRYPFPI